MNVNEIKALIEAMGASDLAEMEVSKDGWTLRLSRAVSLDHPLDCPSSVVPPSKAAGPRAAAAASARKHEGVTAPLSGVVYLSATPVGPPFVEVGSTVEPGDVLCVVEAMKIFNEVRAERAGTVKAILVASGAEVDAGQTLIEVG